MVLRVYVSMVMSASVLYHMASDCSGHSYMYSVHYIVLCHMVPNAMMNTYGAQTGGVTKKCCFLSTQDVHQYTWLCYGVH